MQVKPGDVIVRVGQTQLGNVSSQNQTLANLRELILGEPGTFVVLGYACLVLDTSSFCYFDKPCRQASAGAVHPSSMKLA